MNRRNKVREKEMQRKANKTTQKEKQVHKALIRQTYPVGAEKVMKDYIKVKNCTKNFRSNNNSKAILHPNSPQTDRPVL